MRKRWISRFLTGFIMVMPWMAPFSIGYCQQPIPAGNIRVVQDDRVDVLVNKHIQLNRNAEGIDGYRIQIFFDSGANSKGRAQAIYNSFQARYPETGAYLTYKSPNYKVRVGDFRTRLDAQRFLNQIISDYPNAWIVEDIINLPTYP